MTGRRGRDFELPIPAPEDDGPDPDEVLEKLRPTWISRIVDLGVGGLAGLMSVSIVLNVMGGDFAANWVWILAGLFSGLVGLHWIARALSPRPRLEWDEQGIIDRTSVLSGELRIPWADIRDVSTSRFDGRTLLELREGAAVLDDLPIGRRLQLLRARLRGVNALEINPSFLRVKYGDLTRALETELLEAERRAVLAGRTSTDGPGPDRTIG